MTEPPAIGPSAIGPPLTGPPRFSVIIPARQEGAYIGRSLRHLTGQRAACGHGVEIIVVDGDSTDDTVAQASALADQVITGSPPASQSIALARNVGAAAASGEFLFHTDADVIIPDLPGLLDAAAGALAVTGAVAVTARIMPYPWEATRLDRMVHRAANAYNRASYSFGAYFARGECQIIRREAFEAVGGYRGDLISGEDCDLFRRLSRTGRVAYLPGQQVYHSPRRFRRLGYLRVLAVYTREAVWMAVFRRSYTREWPVVR